MIRAAQLVGLGSGRVALSGGAAGLVRSNGLTSWAHMTTEAVSDA